MDHVAHRDVTQFALVPTFTFFDVTHMWCCMFLLRFDLFMCVVNVIFFPLAKFTFGMCNIFSIYLEVSVMEVMNSDTTELSIEVPCLWSGYIVKR